MTAIICVCQKRHNLAHIVTDAAMYRDGEGISAFGSKCFAISHWGIITAAGTSLAVPLFAWELGKIFSSWDDFVDRANAELPQFAELVRGYGMFHASVVLAGISETRGAESFTFQTTVTLPPGVTQAEADANEYFRAPFTLAKLPAHIMTPVPGPEISIAANYEGIDVDTDDLLMFDWTLRKMLAMQRAMPLPEGVGGIGGFAQISSICAVGGISQRIIARWPEDKMGGRLRPDPIDWKQWHRDNPKPSGLVPAKERKLQVV